MQIGAPRDIYQFPQSEFVADFLGVANLLDVEVTDAGGVGAGQAWATSRSMPRFPGGTAPGTGVR